jgi:thymidylate synthase (FAD)
MNDGIGFVELLDVFGDDITVVNAARVSFAKEVTVIKEGDKKLIKYLARHNHISPFFHPQVRMRIKMPIFVAREWFRHTVGFSRNEVSRRYVDSVPEVWVPGVDDLRERDKNKKQGSKMTAIDSANDIREDISHFMDTSIQLYNYLLKANVAPEIARCVLPQSMYTEFIETASLAAYARLVALRLDPGAQIEIRRYAEAVCALMVDAFPVSWAALEEARGTAVGESQTNTEVKNNSEVAGSTVTNNLNLSAISMDFVTSYWGT